MSAIRRPAKAVDNRVSQSHDAGAPDVPNPDGTDPALCMSENGQNPDLIKIGWGGARPGAGRKPAQRVIQRNPPGPRWYVLQVVTNAVDRIVRDLAEGEDRRGYTPRPPFEVQLPIQAVERLRRGKRETVHVPMFAGYVFVRFDRDTDNWPAVQQVDGVLRVFTTKSLNPIPVPAGFVEMLIASAPERLNLALERMPAFAPGQALRLVGGPMDGFPAQCVACDGLTTQITVHVFGRDVEMSVRRDGLVAA